MFLIVFLMEICCNCMTHAEFIFVKLVAISLKIHDHFVVDEANDLSGLQTFNLCCRLWDQKWAPNFENTKQNYSKFENLCK